MSHLLNTIRNDSLAARKAKDAIASALLVTLLSEASLPGLNDGKRASTDAETLAVVRKFLKNNAETLAVRPEDSLAQRERLLLEKYVPDQLDEAQLRDAIATAAQNLGLATVSAKDTGVLMKALNANHAGRFAGAQASALIKNWGA